MYQLFKQSNNVVVDIILFSLFLYLFLALVVRFWNIKKKSEALCWLPAQYKKDFYCVSTSSSLISKGNEIPTDCPTLLIIGSLRTNNKAISILDDLANLLTFGWLNFNEILPLGSPLNLRLHLKNISQNDFPINGAISNFFIRYPGDPEYPPKKDNESQHYQIPSRMWSIQIPSLSCGSTYIDFSENFFFPETAGPHELIIDGINGVRMAGPFGIGGRKYRIANPGAPWKYSFHVSNSHEHKSFMIAFLALLISMITLIGSIIDKL